jgi:hypothetical protein
LFSLGASEKSCGKNGGGLVRTGFKNTFSPQENFPQGLKPIILAASSGTAEAVPYPKTDF